MTSTKYPVVKRAGQKKRYIETPGWRDAFKQWRRGDGGPEPDYETVDLSTVQMRADADPVLVDTARVDEYIANNTPREA